MLKRKASHVNGAKVLLQLQVSHGDDEEKEEKINETFGERSVGKGRKYGEF